MKMDLSLCAVKTLVKYRAAVMQALYVSLRDDCQRILCRIFLEYLTVVS